MAKSISVAVGDSETMRWGPWIAAAVEVAEVGVELLPLPHAVASSTSQTITKDRRSTFPPSARGTDWRRTAGLLTRGSLPRRLPGSRPVAPRREDISPHSGGTVPELHRLPLP